MVVSLLSASCVETSRTALPKIFSLLSHNVHIMRKTALILLSMLLLTAVVAGFWWKFKQPIYVPKPLGYPRITLPPQAYKPLSGSLPYTFEVSQHAVITQDTSSKAEQYWINIRYPAFEAEIQLTYKPVKNNLQLLREYCANAYKLTAKHQVKATSIQEKSLQTKQGCPAILIDLSGEVPSQVQFYTTDMKHHFLRGALYFNTATQNDYLAPVIAFIRADIVHLIQTLEWKQVK